MEGRACVRVRIGVRVSVSVSVRVRAKRVGLGTAVTAGTPSVYPSYLIRVRVRARG